MNLVAVWTAVQARIATDTGTGGLAHATAPLVTGFYTSFNVPGAVYPYIVFDVDGAEQQDAFEVDGIDLSIRFHVFAKMEQATTSGFETCAAIIDRLYGDALDQAGRTPSFGFHRHNFVIASGKYAGSIMKRVGMAQEHDVDVLHFIESYRVLISNGV